MLATLIAYSILLPMDGIAAEKEVNPDHAVIITEENTEIPVYLTDDTEAEVVAYLVEDDEVTVLESKEHFTLIELDSEDKDDTHQQGYVENHYLDFTEDKESKDENDNSESAESEHKQEDSETVSPEEPEEIEDTEENNADEIQTAKAAQTQYEGIALKKSTNVYAKNSVDADILKSYPEGSILKYRSYDANWFEATVIIKGKKNWIYTC